MVESIPGCFGYLREIQTTKPYSYELIQDREKPKQLVLLEEIINALTGRRGTSIARSSY